MRRRLRTTGFLVPMLAIICAGTPGCGLLELLLGGNPIQLVIPPNSILVVFENQSGLPVRIEADLVLSETDVRKTIRVLDATGNGATAALVRTIAERLEVKAFVDDTAPQPDPFDRKPGDQLLELVLLQARDYNAGDVVNIIIPGPDEPEPNPQFDCNNNGINDPDEIANGAPDCDNDLVPDDCESESDNDGVVDDCDNCPNKENPGQADQDQNNIGDACDIGACCMEDGTCNDLSFDDCTATGGAYDGSGTACETTTCPQPTGACCGFDGSCSDLTEQECINFERDYQGDGTDCNTFACPQPTGACCLEDGSCDDVTEEDCNSLEGDYEGDFTDCNFTFCPEPTGACCFFDGTCEELPSIDCEKTGGFFEGGGTSCDSVDCPIPMGACCMDDGTCADLTEADCVSGGGNYDGDLTDCQTTMCPQPTGACCMDDGTCEDLTEEDCTNADGDYEGDGTDCNTTMCPEPTGACCMYDGTCQVLTENDCNNSKGSYEGDGTDCQMTVCEQPTGACCIDGECNDLDEDTCLRFGGFYEGDFSICFTGICDKETEACCLSDGTCQDIHPKVCFIMQGEPQGFGSTCDNEPCDSISLTASSSADWVYENLLFIPPGLRGGLQGPFPPATDCKISFSAQIDDDPLGNSSYSFEWRFTPPADRPNSLFTAVDSEFIANPTFLAPFRPGHSPTRLPHDVTVQVTGDQFGNTGSATINVMVRLLGDVNDDGCVDMADIDAINAGEDSPPTDPDVFATLDVDCNGVINGLDAQKAQTVQLNLDGNGSGFNCP